MNRTLLIALLTIICIISGAANASIYSVKTTGLDSNDGLSWATSVKTVTRAVALAKSGDEIWVMAGTYVERFSLKSGIGLYGGFAGTETTRTQRNPTANLTSIDGNSGGIVVSITGASSSTVLDGFTIKGGASTGDISMSNSQAVISNDIVTGSVTRGIYISGGNPYVLNCQITNNGTIGIHCYYTITSINGNTIRGNKTNGLYLDTTTSYVGSNVIRDNKSSGIYVNSPANIVGNQICYNQSSTDGGGIKIDAGAPNILGNTITGNIAVADGGGIYGTKSSAVISNNVISWNTAGEGGGISLYMECDAKVTNNTIVNNAAMGRTNGGGVTLDNASTTVKNVTVANNLIAFNSTGVYRYDTVTTPVLSHNCLWANGAYGYRGMTAGATDIAADPLLASTSLGDYHLTAASPCVNTGDDSAAGAGAKDIDGEARIAGAHVDIGADEYVAGRTVAASRKVWFVKPTGSDGAAGTTWAKARATISAGLAPALPGDSVWVAAGTYTDALVVPAGVSLLGGFNGTETAESQRDPAADIVTVNAAAHRVIDFINVGANTLADGLTFQNGLVGYTNVYCSYSAPTVSNCIIQSSTGLGVYGYNSSPTITGCTVRNNTAQGIYMEASDPLITKCAITGNHGSNGAGIYLSNGNGAVTLCTITGNTAVYTGGGIYCINSVPRIQANTIRQNSVTNAGSIGGGIYCDNCQATIVSNVIAYNTSEKAGGIKINNSSTTTVAGNTIAYNAASSTSQAGGIEMTSYSSPVIANNIIAFNGGCGVVADGTGAPAPFSNCLFGNSGLAYKGLSAGAGDITSDPLLRDPNNGDYHIKNTSPCVNAGNNTFAAGSAIDIDAQPRIYGARVDIGADEVRPFGVADFNGDGMWDAVAQGPSGEIALLLMNGPTITGSYSLSPKLPAGWLVGGTGDFMGDGTTSLAVQNLATQQISILGIGGKYFTSSIPLTPSMLPNWQIKCAGDFNGDGQPDLVCQNTQTRDISILIISGLKIKASISVNPTLPAGWVLVGAGDFDGDGKSDIVVQNTQTQAVSILFMNGTAIKSSTSITPNLPAGWNIVGVSDVNGDARPDILVQNSSTRQVSALMVSGTKFVGSVPVTPTLGVGWGLVGPK